MHYFSLSSSSSSILDSFSSFIGSSKSSSSSSFSFDILDGLVSIELFLYKGTICFEIIFTAFLVLFTFFLITIFFAGLVLFLTLTFLTYNFGFETAVLFNFMVLFTFLINFFFGIKTEDLFLDAITFYLIDFFAFLVLFILADLETFFS